MRIVKKILITANNLLKDNTLSSYIAAMCARYRVYQGLITSLLLVSSCTSSETLPEQSSSQTATHTTAQTSEATQVQEPIVAPQAPTLIRTVQSDTLTFQTKPGFAADYAVLRQDTLLVIANSINILYPFGQVKRAVDIRYKYPQFNFTRGTEQANGLVSAYTLLRYKHSSVKFYDDEEYGATVVAGRITDSDLVLQNTIHTGLPLAQVIHILFTDIDQTKLQHLHVLRIDYAAAGIKYFYSFESNRLKEINLDSYSVMSKEL